MKDFIMKPVSIHQADLWAYKIYNEAKKNISEKGDNFDAMLFIESKIVRDILPQIVESLNQKDDLGLKDKHNLSHYTNALLSLGKAATEVYGKTDNIIENEIKSKGNAALNEGFTKLKETIVRFSEKSHERDIQNEEIKLGQ
jgi:hypothetical protein